MIDLKQYKVWFVTGSQYSSSPAVSIIQRVARSTPKRSASRSTCSSACVMKRVCNSQMVGWLPVLPISVWL